MNQTDTEAEGGKPVSLGKVLFALCFASQMGVGAEPLLSTEPINPDGFVGPAELQDTFLPSQLALPKLSRERPGAASEWIVL